MIVFINKLCCTNVIYIIKPRLYNIPIRCTVMWYPQLTALIDAAKIYSSN